MKVYLRKRKQGQNGKVSLYLDINYGSIRTPDGKIKTHREYNYLKLFLTDKPRTATERHHNKTMLQLADKIRSKKEYELNTSISGFTPTISFKDSNFCEYFYDKLKSKHGAKTNFKDLEGIYNTFVEFAGSDILFSEITEKFCERYLQYLQRKISKRGSHLSNVTINHYYHYFSTTIQQAIKEKIITDNPLLLIKKLKTKKVKKLYLTLEELKVLVNTNCKQSELKRAFLFSCLTGLRWSDVYKLSRQDFSFSLNH